MKKMKASRYLFLGTLFTGLSALAAPQASIKFSVSPKGGVDMTLDASGLQDSATYQMKIDRNSSGNANWYVSEKNNSQWKIEANGEIRKPLSNRLLVPGQVLIVETKDAYNFNKHLFALTIPCSDQLVGYANNNYRVAMKDMNTVRTIMSAINCGTNTPAPAPQQPQQPAPAPAPAPAPVGPTQDQVDAARKLGAREARAFIRKVVNTYGKMEQYRYNVYQGLSFGLANTSALDLQQQTNQGYNIGAASGQHDGSITGAQSGSNDGGQAGGADAQQRFESSINLPGVPDTSLGPVKPSVPSSFQMNAPQSANLSARLAQMDAQLSASLQGTNYEYDDGYDDVVLSYQGANRPISVQAMYNWKNYQADMIQSGYRSDWALSLYKDRDFGGKDHVATYKALCQQSQVLCSAFEDSFKTIYDNDIGTPWNAMVLQGNIPAYQQGETYGIQIARSMAYDQGVSLGYSASYQNAARTAYGRAYSQAYSSNFDSVVQRFENNAIIEGGDADIYGTSGAFVLGQPITVVVKGLRNAGRQQATLGISLSGVVSVPNAGTVTLAPSSSMPDKALQNVAALPAQLPVDTDLELDITVGQQVIRKSIRISFEDQVAMMAATQSPSLVEYIRQVLTQEWANNPSAYDQKHPEQSFVGRLASKARSLPPEQHAFVKSLVPQFAEIYGSAPSRFFHPFQHSRWVDATALLNGI